MRSKPKPRARAVSGGASPIVRVRKPKRLIEIQLFVRAGGRCELEGCNEYLLEHHVTLTPGNFAQQAHIVAFSARGPRANPSLPADLVGNLDNLMLLCARCHKQIDDDPGAFPVTRLERFKASHEERIRHLTGIASSLKTTIVQLKARIAGRSVSIPFDHITRAVDPRYPLDRRGVLIDLTAISVPEHEFFSVAQAEITKKISEGLDPVSTHHVSVFAMGPIPLLVHLGRELSDKIAVDLFQRHRETEDWTWKENGVPAEYALNVLRDGSDRERVALCLSLSGKILPKALPSEIDDRFSIYEIALTNKEAEPTFLSTRADVVNFRIAYQKALRTIGARHAGLKEIHLFPAIPAPVAVACGRQLLPKIDPSLLVYDADKARGGFFYSLTVR